jgi:hypothetical protein
MWKLQIGSFGGAFEAADAEPAKPRPERMRLAAPTVVIASRRLKNLTPVLPKI